jgi:protein-arginine kinase
MRASTLISRSGATSFVFRYARLVHLTPKPRGIHGEHSETEGGVFDISNKERLGKSEVELVQTMIDGVTALIAAEKALAAGKQPPAI